MTRWEHGKREVVGEHGDNKTKINFQELSTLSQLSAIDSEEIDLGRGTSRDKN